MQAVASLAGFFRQPMKKSLTGASHGALPRMRGRGKQGDIVTHALALSSSLPLIYDLNRYPIL